LSAKIQVRIGKPWYASSFDFSKFGYGKYTMSLLETMKEELSEFDGDNHGMAKSVKLLLERVFILGFGILHLFLPLFVLPNPAAQPIHIFTLSLEMADLVIAGCIALPMLTIVFTFSKKRCLGSILILMYLSGAALHISYFLSSTPPLVTVPRGSLLYFLNVPLNAVLAIGIFMDFLVSAIIFNYCYDC